MQHYENVAFAVQSLASNPSPLRVPISLLLSGLENVWEVKPLVNGKEIMNILELKTGGPLVREWVSQLSK